MKSIERTSLYYSEGRSDKEYHAEIVEVADGHVVNYRYGRRGASLTCGTKTAVPVGLAQAKTIYDRLVKEKTAKGYTPDAAGSPYQGPDHTQVKSGFLPQLLNPISEAQARRLIEDEDWGAQEKMDGERRAAHVEKDQAYGSNRKGLIVPLPLALADELQSLYAQNGALLFDGEMIGDTLWVFDLLRKGRMLQALPWRVRMQQADEAVQGFRHLQALPVAVTTDAKRRLWNTVKAAKGEGIVFKRLSSPVTAGRPNGGGDWLKYKFTASATCYVMDVNPGKRSVKIGLLDNGALKRQTILPVGNVTIPPNHTVPTAGAIVEVEYLYAYPGGSLYQPVYRGIRMDRDIEACTPHQLKYKPEGREDEEA
jgi:bifunctional non-homologous end joining protein LigD